MNRARLEDHLAAAERHLAEAQRQVAGLREHLARLERDGHDTAQATRLLAQYEEVLAMHIADRDRMRKALGLKISRPENPSRLDDVPQSGNRTLTSPTGVVSSIARPPAGGVSFGENQTPVQSVSGHMDQQHSIEDIARVCHEANRAWCFVNGDVSQVEWAEAPAWQRESAIRGVEFALANPDAPDSAQHDAWSAGKVRDGWQYGPVKDSQAKTHPCLVAFDQLPAHQQAKDRLFHAIVRALANRLG